MKVRIQQSEQKHKRSKLFFPPHIKKTKKTNNINDENENAQSNLFYTHKRKPVNK